MMTVSLQKVSGFHEESLVSAKGEELKTADILDVK